MASDRPKRWLPPQPELEKERRPRRVDSRVSLTGDERPLIGDDRLTVDYNFDNPDLEEGSEQQQVNSSLHDEDPMAVLMHVMASWATTAQQQQRTMDVLAVSSDKHGQTISDFMRQQSRVREQVELEKTTIRNLKAWDPSMNLASYIQEFEDCMCRGKIHKDKWCNIITSQFKGQVWQDWIDHKELGDEDGYENAKEMVLEMHGVSLLQCIKSTFRLKKDGETFGARATAARVNINRLQKGTTTLDEPWKCGSHCLRTVMSVWLRS